MTFRALECAVKIAGSDSLSKAADKLLVSQPYLSGMLKSLEDELGFRIFLRDGNGIVPTELGAEFLTSAGHILRELERIRRLGSRERDTLTVSSYYSTNIMKKFLDFRARSEQKYPDSLREMGNQEILESVMCGRSSLGLLVYAYDKRGKYEEMIRDMGLQLRVVFEKMPVYVCMGRGHALAGREDVSLAEFAEYPYVSYDDDSSLLYLMNVLHIAGHPRLLKVSDRGSFHDALDSGEYLTITAFSKRPDDDFPFALRRLRDKELYLTLSAVTPGGQAMTAREKQFLALLKE